MTRQSGALTLLERVVAGCRRSAAGKQAAQPQSGEPRRRLVAAMASAEGGAASGTTGRLFQGVSRQEFGFKMLQSMGWSEGQARERREGCGGSVLVLTQRHTQGLGASGTGITKHIAAVRRQDQIGACGEARRPAARC
jgi:hypothetical protein